MAFIATHGARAIVLSGGEPTLLPDLSKTLNLVKSYGLQTAMSTNGLLLDDRMLAKIANDLDWIALPVDGPSERLHRLMRVGSPPGYFDQMLRLLAQIKVDFPRLGVKVGTVVTRINAESVSRIPSLFSGVCRPDVWKLYEVSFSNYGKDNRSDLELEPGEFEAVVEQATASAAKSGIRLVVYRNADRDGKYLFIDPTGDAQVITGGDEMCIGNIFREPLTVLQEVARRIDFDKVHSNFSDTYPAR